MGPRLLRYDLEELPNPPYSVYMFNDIGHIDPKRVFTVTEKRINPITEQIELFILEKNDFIVYAPHKIETVRMFNPN